MTPTKKSSSPRAPRLSLVKRASKLVVNEEVEEDDHHRAIELSRAQLMGIDLHIHKSGEEATGARPRDTPTSAGQQKKKHIGFSASAASKQWPLDGVREGKSEDGETADDEEDPLKTDPEAALDSMHALQEMRGSPKGDSEFESVGVTGVSPTNKPRRPWSRLSARLANVLSTYGATSSFIVHREEFDRSSQDEAAGAARERNNTSSSSSRRTSMPFRQGSMFRAASHSFSEHDKHIARQLQLKRSCADRYQLDPVRSRVLMVNSMLQIAAIVYVAFTVPFETSFLLPENTGLGRHNAEGQEDARFLANRAAQCVFLVDIIVGLLTPYRKPNSFKYEFNPDKIAVRYVQSWFPIDLLGCMPWFLIYSPPWTTNVPPVWTRIIRMLIMVKVLKLHFHLHRLYTMFERDIYTALGEYFMVFATVVHWMACIWVFAAIAAKQWASENETSSSWARTWIDATADSKLIEDIYMDGGKTGATYLTALHFSVMTITTVGYGDISPQNRVEYAVAIGMQVVGAFVYTYVIAVIMSLVSVVDENSWVFLRRMNNLNALMKRVRLPEDSRMRMRLYLFNARPFMDREGQREVAAVLSPPMQAELYAFEYSGILSRLPYFKCASSTFIVEVAKIITPIFFAPLDCFATPATLYVIANNGLVAHEGKIYSKHACLGADFMVTSWRLRWTSPAFVLTYVEVLTMHRIQLEEVLLRFPTDGKKVHRAAHWVALKRYMRLWARSVLTAENDRLHKQQAKGTPEAVTIQDSVKHMSPKALRRNFSRYALHSDPEREEENLSIDPILEQRMHARKESHWIKTQLGKLTDQTDIHQDQLDELSDQMDEVLAILRQLNTKTPVPRSGSSIRRAPKAPDSSASKSSHSPPDPAPGTSMDSTLTTPTHTERVSDILGNFFNS